MDYLKILRENPDLAEEFDSLFDFFLLDELSPRDDAEGRCTFSLPGMAFARDGSGGEYHLLEDGSIGYYSSEGEAGRLAENMDDLFSLIVSCICWHDCCDAKHYVCLLYTSSAAKKLLADCETWDKAMRELAAKNLTELANEWLSQDNENARNPETDPITEEELVRRISMTSLSVTSGGSFTAWFDCDEMFTDQIGRAHV